MPYYIVHVSGPPGARRTQIDVTEDGFETFETFGLAEAVAQQRSAGRRYVIVKAHDVRMAEAEALARYGARD